MFKGNDRDRCNYDDYSCNYFHNYKHIIYLAKSLISKTRKLAGKKITLLGLAFKPGTDDMRQAASIRVINELRKRSVSDIIGFDPKANKTAEVELGHKIKYASSVEEALKDSECALLITEWDEFKSRGKRSEILTGIFIRAKTDDSNSSTMKIIITDNNLGLI